MFCQKSSEPGRRRELVRQVQAAHGVSERRSCVALGVERSTIRYRSTKPDQAPLRLRIRDLAKARVRYGYFRIYILPRREGWMVNHKRVYRLYREEGLCLRLKRPRRHVSAADRERQPAATALNALWSMDFISDALFDGRRLRALTVVDAFTREALAIEVDQGIKGDQVVAVMTRLALIAGHPAPSGCATTSYVRSVEEVGQEISVRQHQPLPGDRQHCRGLPLLYEEFSAIANIGSSGTGAAVLTVLNRRYRSERKTRSLSTGSPTRPHGPSRKGALPLGTATSMKGR
jgi:hypothetical protein